MKSQQRVIVSMHQIKVGLRMATLLIVPGMARENCAQVRPTPTAAGVTGKSPGPSRGSYCSFLAVPAHFRGSFKTLGNRLAFPGNDRVALPGALKDSNGTVAAQITLELGRDLQFDAVNCTLSFRGTYLC
jgi:hypothetical protein